LDKAEEQLSTAQKKETAAKKQLRHVEAVS